MKIPWGRENPVEQPPDAEQLKRALEEVIERIATLRDDMIKHQNAVGADGDLLEQLMQRKQQLESELEDLDYHQKAA